MAKFPAPTEDIVLTYFIASRDVERSRRFYSEVLGGETVLDGEPTVVALANGWIIINVGGGPTDDKPTVTLEAPSDQIGSARFSISGSPTSMPCTRIGAGAGQSF